jgi:endoglucanase
VIPAPGRRTLGRAAAAAAAAAALLAVAACGSAPAVPDRLYADPDGPLAGAVAELQTDGQHGAAAELEQITRTPAGIWLAGQPGDLNIVGQATRAAARADAWPVFVVYDLPDRDACGGLSADGGPSAQGYEDWIGQIAAAIGATAVIVVVEPDGLPDIVRGCLSPAQGAERYRLLRYAMRRLGALPRARVYLDAGNPGMFADPSRLAGPLEAAGIGYGRGFSANVSNFQWTADVVAWSQALERDLGGHAGAVIDTSRNGRGPYTGPDTPQWCNPPGRALGPAPRLDPGPGGIDAYLWIKDPGASDGTCNGGPAAGQGWPQYAQALIRPGEADA